MAFEFALNNESSTTSQCTRELSKTALDPNTVEEALPEYSESVAIIPMSPSQNDRYERGALVTPQYMTIPRGIHSAISLLEPPYLPAGWSVWVNPEGSPYYLNLEKHVVADVPIKRTDELYIWIKHFETEIAARDIPLPEDYELYINPDVEGKTCKYYFVDHSNQTVFWMDDVDQYQYDIDLPPVCSITHLKFALQQQYWRHCEFFPHHTVPVERRNELINIFNQARADLLTSQMSTFPYSAEQCKHFLQILESDSQPTEHSNWNIARLWATIARHRYDIFYGEDHARISRDQARYEKAAPQRTPMMKKGFTLLFNMPIKRANELKLLFVDEIAFGTHWQEFATTVIRDWQQSSIWAMSIATIGAILSMRHNNPMSAGLGSLSIVSALGGMASSALLLQRYAGAEKYNAAIAADHLYQIEHPIYGFELAAAVYTLPHALVFWSMIFLAAHVASAFVNVKTLIVQTPAIALTLGFAIILYRAGAIVHKGFKGAAPGET